MLNAPEYIKTLVKIMFPEGFVKEKKHFPHLRLFCNHYSQLKPLLSDLPVSLKLIKLFSVICDISLKVAVHYSAMLSWQPIF